MVKIFIPSYNRPDTHTTPGLLLASGVTDFQVIVREAQYKAYAKHLPTHNLMTIGNGLRLNAAREAARECITSGEWCLHMDDNVQGFIAPAMDFYYDNQEVPLEPGETMVTRARWQSTMNVKVDFTTFYKMVVYDTMQEAIIRGAWLAGFSAHDNPAFRHKKYSDVGYVCGKMMLMRNGGLPWNQSKESSGEDYALTAAHLYDDGRVLINKWGHPMRTHYQPGGCGPYEQRLPAMQRAQKELLGRYGALLGAKNANHPDKKQGELRIRFHSLEQVEAWRSSLTKDPNRR